MSRPVDTSSISPLVLSQAREALSRLHAAKPSRWFPEGYRATREERRAKMAEHQAAVAALNAFGALVVDAITSDPTGDAMVYAQHYGRKNPHGARRLKYWAEDRA